MSGTSGSTYLLEGDNSELRQHANQEVEIRGRIESSTSGSTSSYGSTGSTAGSTSSATSGSNRSASSSSTNAQRVRVESVREISSTCSSR
ncbi:MAG TPA: hypothetical protein VFA27_00165 [Vicinamibacterales bacterium]|nr:hypothetical protein [Vicinamibacterales bacterium]